MIVLANCCLMYDMHTVYAATRSYTASWTGCLLFVLSGDLTI